MLVGIYCVIAAVYERDLKVYQWIACDGPVLSRFDDAFFDRRAEVLRYRAAEDLVDPLKSAAAFKRLKYDLAITKLASSAGLFLMTALNFRRCGDRFFIGNLRRMKRDLNVITVRELFHDGLDMKLARSGQNKFLCLWIAVEMERRVFFQNPMEGS